MVFGKLLVIAAVAGLVGLATGRHAESIRPGPSTDFVTVMVSGRSLAVARGEVNFALWKQCHQAGACSHLPRARGDNYPVTGVNYFDVAEFLGWINSQGRGHFRLPTAVEWRSLPGAPVTSNRKKLFDDPRLAWAADYGAGEGGDAIPRPTGAFGKTSEGIADLTGNVWEWTATCASPAVDDHCPAYLAEGQHEAAISVFIRDPASGGCALGTPPDNLGFRLVRAD